MIRSISIENYRNIRSLKFEFSPKANIILAPNGSGKTNFLESIFYSVYGQSFKEVSDTKEYIGGAREFTNVDLDWNERILRFVVADTEGKVSRKFFSNGKQINRANRLKLFPVIVFAPNSVDLISGEPRARRDDMDNYFSLLDHKYEATINTYKVLLRNRNALLKQIRDHPMKRKELSFWTERLIESADEIYGLRTIFFAELSDLLRDISTQIDLIGGEHRLEDLSLQYIPSIISSDYKKALADKFAQNQDKEIVVGSTLYGVHKDDFKLMLKDRDMRFQGSRGQQRIATIIYKLAQASLYRNSKEYTPLILLDDVMSEFDSGNAKKIADYMLQSEYQFIISSAKRDELPESLLAEGVTIPLIDQLA